MKKIIITLTLLNSISAFAVGFEAYQGNIVVGGKNVVGNITTYSSVGFAARILAGPGLYRSIETKLNGANLICKYLGHKGSIGHSVAKSNNTCDLTRLNVDFFNLFEGTGKFLEMGRFCDESSSRRLKKVYGELKCED